MAGAGEAATEALKVAVAGPRRQTLPSLHRAAFDAHYRPSVNTDLKISTVTTFTSAAAIIQ